MSGLKWEPIPQSSPPQGEYVLFSVLHRSYDLCTVGRNGYVTLGGCDVYRDWDIMLGANEFTTMYGPLPIPFE